MVSALAALETRHVSREGLNLREAVLDFEERLLREALELTQNNRTEAARLLGVKRSTFMEKLRRMRERCAAKVEAAHTDAVVLEVQFR